MRILITIVIAILITSCGSTKVDYDYDEQATFAQYKTYNYLPDMQSGLSDLDLDRLIKATDSVLQSQGLSKSDSPDLLIDLASSQYKEDARSSVGLGVGGGGRGGGIGIGGGIPIGGNSLHQTITINMVDARKDALIWQAVSDSNLKLSANPQQRQAYFDKMMAKVFKGFPPSKK